MHEPKDTRLAGQARRMGEVIEKAGGAVRVAQRLDVNRGTLLKWKKGEARIPLDEAAQLAAEAGVSLEWLAFGSCDDGTTAVIPRYAPDAMGNPVRQPPDADTLAVHADFFTLHRLDAASTGLARVTGEAMAPELPDGSLVIIDMRATNFTDEGLWVLGRPGAVMVRRLMFEGDTAKLYAANSNYPTVAIKGGAKHEFKVWGRVAFALTRK